MSKRNRRRKNSSQVVPWGRTPAVLALLVQLLSFALTLLTRVLLDALFDVTMHVMMAAAFQGALAALMSRYAGQAGWWQWIQFVFPIGLVLMLGLHLPPPLFLGAFLILLLLYWSTFRTQVPFYPSRSSTWNTVAQLLPGDKPVHFVDIGSGLGGLPLYLALQGKKGTFTGIEIAPLPWMISRMRAWMAGSKARFRRGDYRDLDFGQYDVIFAYLSPAAMPALWEKACSEMREGALLLSYEFSVPDVQAEIAIQDDSGGPTLYGWKM